MQQAKVYFTDFRTSNGRSVLDKLKMLMRRAGIEQIDFSGKFVAIKMHFGEPGNLAYLRPNYARAVADLIKDLGGKPFLTDCNTLYPGRRKNALEHLEAAWENGFTEAAVGCPVIIADGLKGTDETLVPVQGEIVTQAKIGHAIMDADIFVSLTHFKGHESTGFGGALKNIGMGCGSRAGKMEQHNAGKPQVDQSACRGCRLCARQCAQNAISYEGGKAHIDQTRCVGCGRCIGGCNFDAIHPTNSTANHELCMRMAEYALAVVQGRPQFHVALAMDISPYCDCHSENDAPILPDIGMLAGFDAVALDQACADLCAAQTPIRNSVLGDKMAAAGFVDLGDPFANTTPATHWQDTLEHAEKLGMGTRSYELITIK